MKTCVLVPTFQSENRLPLFFNYLRKLEPKPDKLVFLENNSTDNTLLLLENFAKEGLFDTKIIRLWFKDDRIGEPPLYRMAIIRDILLQYARKLNVDYAFFVDDDVLIISTNMIHILTNLEKDIVGASVKMSIMGVGVVIDAVFGTLSCTYPKTQLNFPIESCLSVGWNCVCLSKRVLQDKRLNCLPLVVYNGYWTSEGNGFDFKAGLLGYKIFVTSIVKIVHVQYVDKKRSWSGKTMEDFAVDLALRQPNQELWITL